MGGGGREGGHRKLYRQPGVHLYPDRIYKSILLGEK